jgi:hypothetical protein
MQRDDPYRGGDAQAMLAISSARDVERMATAIRQCPLMPELLHDALRDQILVFKSSNPRLTDARNVIEHIDEYMKSAGHDGARWFDLTKRFAPGQFLLRIGGDLSIDMVNMAVSAIELSETARKVVSAWGGLELKMRQAVQLGEPFLARGINVRVVSKELADDEGVDTAR